jgi:hypothetical protein
MLSGLSPRSELLQSSDVKALPLGGSPTSRTRVPGNRNVMWRLSRKSRAPIAMFRESAGAGISVPPCRRLFKGLSRISIRSGRTQLTGGNFPAKPHSAKVLSDSEKTAFTLHLELTHKRIRINKL